MARTLLVIITCGVLCAGTVASAVVTEGFEGDLTGSPPSGASSIVGNVTVQTGTDFTGDPIAATEGVNFAYLTTGPGSTGAGSSGVDRTGDWGFENDIAEMTIPLTLALPSSVSFDYDLLTYEITGTYPDPFEVKLDGVSIVKGAVGAANGSFPAVVGFSGVSIGGPDGSSFYDGRLGWTTYTTALLPAGSHSLEFFVGDAGDKLYDTALLVDNIAAAPIPEPCTFIIWSLLGALAITVGWWRRRR